MLDIAVSAKLQYWKLRTTNEWRRTITDNCMEITGHSPRRAKSRFCPHCNNTLTILQRFTMEYCELLGPYQPDAGWVILLHRELSEHIITHRARWGTAGVTYPGFYCGSDDDSESLFITFVDDNKRDRGQLPWFPCAWQRTLPRPSTYTRQFSRIDILIIFTDCRLNI